MKLGFVSAILAEWNFEDTILTAHDLGFSCLEVASWPQGKAERRYAGVSHIDAERVLGDDAYAAHIAGFAKTNGIQISSLAFYPNTLDSNIAKREVNVSHLKALIRASAKLGVNMVTTFIGRDQYKTVEENLNLVKKVWLPLVKLAESLNVRIAIENCPMLFGPDQWPGGQNLMTSPEIWKKVFAILDSQNIGLNFDPSHFVWQQMDYIKPLYEFRDKILHIHFKDIKLDQEALSKVGVLAYPLDYMRPKLPGLGDVDFGKFVSTLTDINYDGCACIEVEDRAFEGSKEKVLESLKLSKRYMGQFLI